MANWQKIVLQRSNNDLVFLSCNFPDGKKAFYALITSGAKSALLDKVFNMGNKVNLENYGKIIASGWGALTNEIKDNILKEYNNH